MKRKDSKENVHYIRQRRVKQKEIIQGEKTLEIQDILLHFIDSKTFFSLHFNISEIKIHPTNLSYY